LRGFKRAAASSPSEIEIGLREQVGGCGVRRDVQNLPQFINRILKFVASDKSRQFASRVNV